MGSQGSERSTGANVGGGIRRNRCERGAVTGQLPLVASCGTSFLGHLLGDKEVPGESTKTPDPQVP